MTWLQRYRLRSFVQSSLWLLPVGSMLLALAVAPALRRLDAATGWVVLGYTPNGARTLLGALVASALSFIVFTFSILLVAVQLASANLSPRVITSFLSDRTVKLVLASFVFTFTYAAAVLGRIEDSVPQLPMLLALVSSLVSIVAFLYLIDHYARGLRPVAVVERVARDGQKVIESMYPRLLADGEQAAVHADAGLGPPTRTIVHDAISGVVLAIDVRGLVAAAERVGAVIEMIPQVGEFVAHGEPLFRVFGKGDTPAEVELRRAVAFGPSRTLQQDPAFAFRILVDIAVKALSPAVNDPTTAVLAIHQIHRLLRVVGTRDLGTGRINDGRGRLRLIYRTPGWEDFVSLAVTEIRLYGTGSIQVLRRLSAMLENLLEVLPTARSAALREQLSLIERLAHRGFQDPEDQLRAETPDVQGVGGAR